MLDRLGFGYTAISLLSALGTLATIAGYRAWSVIIDRFGSKPVLQILIIPGALNAFLWGLCQPGNHAMVAVAMLLSGLIMGGINLGVTPLQYALLPKENQDERVAYMASWSTTINLLYAAGPLLGGILVASLAGVRFNLGGFLIQDINLLFFLSGIMRFVPLFLLRPVRDARSISSQQLLSNMFRGNLLSYTFNYIVFNVATAEDRRARAAYRLGRSRNPMAIDHLVQALSDASSKVRRQAARALGETGSEAAVDTLIRELESPSSDIRSEAAEALGRLRHARAVDALVEALEDEDPQGADQRHFRPGADGRRRRAGTPVLAFLEQRRPADLPHARGSPEPPRRLPHHQADLRPVRFLYVARGAAAIAQQHLPDAGRGG